MQQQQIKNCYATSKAQHRCSIDIFCLFLYYCASHIRPMCLYWMVVCHGAVIVFFFLSTIAQCECIHDSLRQMYICVCVECDASVVMCFSRVIVPSNAEPQTRMPHASNQFDAVVMSIHFIAIAFIVLCLVTYLRNCNVRNLKSTLSS